MHEDSSAAIAAAIGPRHFARFEDVVDPTLYAPVPEDWVLGLTDVVGSTKAIEQGRYKAVNIAGAAAITATRNALKSEELAFVFGGDGASVAVPGRHMDVLRDTLARTTRWVATELDLTLRAALVPVSAIRAAHHDLRIAWFDASPHARYAMFSGGGLAYAEAAMKAGGFAVPPAPEGDLPDLTGLSCRWTPTASRHGTILSLVMRPAAGASDMAFADAVRAVLALCRGLARGGHPIPESGPEAHWPPPGLDHEARALHGKGSLAWTKAKLLAHTLFAWAIFRTGAKVGGFDPRVYRDTLVLNTDFRKFDDGLRMTLDCDGALADRIEARLEALRLQGIVAFGTFRQNEALITCMVRSPMSDDHLHFVDGAMGGYAAATQRLKAALAA
jgi:Protein of unknown function (DUF3095)